ncbi:hypothetical protein SLA2020_023230 [Shorea laevis]
MIVSPKPPHQNLACIPTPPLMKQHLPLRLRPTREGCNQKPTRESTMPTLPRLPCYPKTSQPPPSPSKPGKKEEENPKEPSRLEPGRDGLLCRKINPHRSEKG